MAAAKYSNTELANLVRQNGEWNFTKMANQMNQNRTNMSRRCRRFIENIRAGHADYLEFVDLLDLPVRQVGNRIQISMDDQQPIEDNSDPWAGIDKSASQAYRAKINKSVREKTQNRFIITSCQNNTDLYEPFFENLEAYARYLDATLIVLPVRYKNVNAYSTREEFEEEYIRYPAKIQKYIINERIKLHPELTLMCDVRVVATAADPLTGMENLAHQASAIYGHAQIRLRTVATPRNENAIVLSTTGSISEKNYSKSKRGEIARFNHAYGAIIIEMDGKDYHHRHITGCNDGSFMDLRSEMRDGKRYVSKTIEALTTGDEHSLFFDQDVLNATYKDKNSIVNYLKPEYIVRHDVLDFYAGSHHDLGNDFIQYKKWCEGLADVEKELKQCCQHIDDTTPNFAMNVIVDSNHNRHFTRWLIENPRTAMTQMNAEIYHYMKWRMLKGIREHENNEVPDPFRLYCEDGHLKSIDNTLFADPDKGFIRSGIDLGQHGDVGANGSRGNANAFAKSSYKSTIGHVHSPEIKRGTFVVGKCPKKLHYERGLSSHMNTHCVQYRNGQRTLINIINGKWALLDK